MVIGPKQAGAALLLGVALFVAWKTFWPAEDLAQKAALRLEVGSEVPAIGLDRLRRADPTNPAPSRDLFKFGRDSRADLAPVPAPVIRLDPIPVATPFPTPEQPPTPTPWPTHKITLIGNVDKGAGRKI